MTKQQVYYCIDLDVKYPEVLEFSGKELEDDLEYFGKNNALELSDYDRKIFETQAEAEAYLRLYYKTLRGLNNSLICKSKKLPVILYKRRYIVQSLLGQKNQTFRDSERVIKIMSQVKVGDLFNLFDQTYFLTVRLKRATKQEDGSMKYEFELP